MRRVHLLFSAATLFGLFGLTQAARAVDVDPGDYTALPNGTNLFIYYNQYVHRDSLSEPGGININNGTSLDSDVSLLRYVHYMALGPITIDPQVIVPIGSLYNAKVGGQSLNSSGGVGDIIPFLTFWAINNPTPGHSEYLGFSPIITVPTGTYDARKSVNLGGNRLTYDAQVGYSRNITPNIILDLTGDAIWYGDNNDYGATHQTLSQHQSYELQAWGRYVLPNKVTSISVGYAGYWGGRQQVDSTFNGTETEHQEVRLAVQHFLTKTIQLEGLAYHDVSVHDGFKQDLTLQARVLKAF